MIVPGQPFDFASLATAENIRRQLSSAAPLNDHGTCHFRLGDVLKDTAVGGGQCVDTYESSIASRQTSLLACRADGDDWGVHLARYDPIKCLNWLSGTAHWIGGRVTIRITLSNQPVKFDRPNSVRRLGLIALATDLTTERDFAEVFGKQVGLYTARVAYDNPTTPENLRRMAPRLTEAAELIIPEVDLDAICYSCTAASVVIGDAEIERAIQSARPDVPVVTPTAAAIAGLRAVGAQRIAILTPYLQETSQPMAEYFAEAFDVARLDCFGLEDDRDMARVSHDTIFEAVVNLAAPDIDAFFISCTALPALHAITQIETRTGRPVVTSNQASAWAMGRLAGIDLDAALGGHLFSQPLPVGAFGTTS